jgi:hypothetical protein
MKNLISTPAKRALAFALALVLVLSLVPVLQLNISAAAYTDGAWYKTDNEWINIKFETAATRVGKDFIFKDNSPYDWKVTITPSKDAGVSSITSYTVITSESGAVVASKSKAVTLAKGSTSTLCTPSDFSALTTDLFGTFTLICQAKLGNTVYASYTQTFSRESTPTIATSASSRSNPDMVFTYADPIDLMWNHSTMGKTHPARRSGNYYAMALVAASDSMDVTDMYGTTTNNLTSATLSECPIYIVCNSGSLSAG